MIEIDSSKQSLKIDNLELLDPDLVDYFINFPQEELLDAFMKAIEVGVYCLQRANSVKDLDFVKRQIDGLLALVQQKVSTIPEETQLALIKKIGSDDGQILSPIKISIESTSKVLDEKINQVRTLLNTEIDPSREDTTIGKALKTLKGLLDEKRTDSIQGALKTAVESVTKKDGQIAITVNKVVEDAIKPLAEEVRNLTMEIKGQEAAADIVEQTTLKGPDFEEYVVKRLQEWARTTGAQIEHVGGDNQPGDIIVRFGSTAINGIEFSTVIEARDREQPKGRRAVNETMEKAMGQRECCCGLYVSKTHDGFAKEIGDWAEGACSRGHWVACTQEHIDGAIRFLIAIKRIDEIKQSKPDVDASLIEAQIARIRSSLSRIANINKKTNTITESVQGIENDSEAIRAEIKDSLRMIEEALRSENENQGDV